MATKRRKKRKSAAKAPATKKRRKKRKAAASHRPGLPQKVPVFVHGTEVRMGKVRTGTKRSAKLKSADSDLTNYLAANPLDSGAQVSKRIVRKTMKGKGPIVVLPGSMKVPKELRKDIKKQEAEYAESVAEILRQGLTPNETDKAWYEKYRASH